MSGEAVVETVDGSCTILPGALYFIPGFHLRRQWCENQMRVYWVHFTPASFYLHHRLKSIRGVVSWPLREKSWIKPDFIRMGEIFEEPEAERNRLRSEPPLALLCRIEAILMWLVGDLLEMPGLEVAGEDDDELLRLKPAIDFMDRHYRENPSLAEVAGRAHLAANYFHRLFKRMTCVTPFEYMEQKRFDDARRLLGEGRLSVKQVAERSGYENPLYFSRAFRQRFGHSPTSFQRIQSIC